MVQKKGKSQRSTVFFVRYLLYLLLHAMGASLSLSECLPCSNSMELDLSSTPPNVSVFVRVRPLTAKEHEAGETLLPGLYMEKVNPTPLDTIAFNGDNTIVGGFSGILGPSTTNKELFDLCFAPNITTVLRGGHSTFFAHGIFICNIHV